MIILCAFKCEKHLTPSNFASYFAQLVNWYFLGELTLAEKMYRLITQICNIIGYDGITKVWASSG